MQFKFIVDAQLPPSLARYLSSHGEDVIHVLDVNMMDASDSAIWDLALSENRVIISKDEDFHSYLLPIKHKPPQKDDHIH